MLVLPPAGSSGREEQATKGGNEGRLRPTFSLCGLERKGINDAALLEQTVPLFSGIVW